MMRIWCDGTPRLVICDGRSRIVIAKVLGWHYLPCLVVGTTRSRGYIVDPEEIRAHLSAPAPTEHRADLEMTMTLD